MNNHIAAYLEYLSLNSTYQEHYYATSKNVPQKIPKAVQKNRESDPQTERNAGFFVHLRFVPAA